MLAKTDREKIGQALHKLQWIAKLSKETSPAGVPDDPEAVRKLLNRIVIDVNSVCKLLTQIQEQKPADSESLIPVHGGYRTLKGFQVAEIIYDGTVIFCDRFISKRSRTHDQMVQAARSGRQNIAEGSMASATSKKTELKLTNVAKASLEELLLDYEDYLRQHRLPLWKKDDPPALNVRKKYMSYPSRWFEKSELSDKSDLSDLSDSSGTRDLLDPYGIATASPEVAANTLICLIHQAIYLLKQQLCTLERNFIAEGGFTERLYRVRSARRNQS